MALGGQRFLSIPWVYDIFQHILGARRFRSHVVASCGLEVSSARILDIGCGTARILDQLPHDVEYVGLDPALAYVQAAKRRYGDRAAFVCASSECILAQEWDVVLTCCVLHHLDDEGVLRLLGQAREWVKGTGVFICADPVLIESGSPIARSMISRDRGLHVRSPEGYLALLTRVFPNVRHSLHDSLMYIPYNHFIAQCRGV